MHAIMSESLPCLCARVRRASRALTAHYDAALTGTGLTTPQFSLLRTLDRAGPLSMTAFAEQTGHDRTTLSRTLRPLEKAGLIVATPNEDQRRRVFSLSEAGAAIIARATPGWKAAQAEIETRLGDDAPRLVALLEKVEALA